jgi:hypothetical protein
MLDAARSTLETHGDSLTPGLRAILKSRETKPGLVSALVPQRGREVVVRAGAVEEEHGNVLALLMDR